MVEAFLSLLVLGSILLGVTLLPRVWRLTVLCLSIGAFVWLDTAGRGHEYAYLLGPILVAPLGAICGEIISLLRKAIPVRAKTHG
jgi:ABC-type multidrug transport system permease subunit